MKVHVGNQVFDTKKVPVAVVLDETELGHLKAMQDKPAGEKHLYIGFPADCVSMIGPWVKENVTDVEVNSFLLFPPIPRAKEA